MSRRVAVPPEITGLRYLGDLGQGGFADVFRYEQTGLGGRDVAVKVLTADLEGRSLAAFEAEAAVMARLSNHPSIVSIFAAGTAADGRAYLVMEVCQPDSLGRRIRQAPYPVPKALEIAVQVAGAVESAHRLGILHRDIKPANILFTEYGRPALTDFGISVSTTEGQQGIGVGMSPAWAPPEQLSSGSPMGPTGDVYSLASTCWAMLVGRSPFEIKGGRNDNLAIAARVRNDPVPSTGRADVPEDLERVLRIAMSKRPEGRYASALEFARALQAVQNSLHLPPTTIEVRDDDQESPAEEWTEGGAATRFSNFAVIDPDVAPGAAPSPGNAFSGAPGFGVGLDTASRPVGDLTVGPDTSTGPGAGAAAWAAGGVAEAAEDLTAGPAGLVGPVPAAVPGPAVAAPASAQAGGSVVEETVAPSSWSDSGSSVDETSMPALAVPTPAPDDSSHARSHSVGTLEQPRPAASPDEAAGDRRRMAYVALALVALLIAGAFVVARLSSDSDGGRGATTQDAPLPSPSAAGDPLGTELPRLEDVKLAVVGDRVRVSWRNVSPQEGDRVFYRLAEPDPNQARDWIRAGPKATSGSVRRLAGRTCVEVRLARKNGQASNPEVRCVS